MKKNQFYRLGIPIKSPKKWGKIMRMTFFLMLLFHLHLCVFAYSQNDKISLKMDNASLETIISELRKQTGVRFFYSQDKVERVVNLSVNVKNKVLNAVLEDLLRSTPLTFTFLDDVVVVKDKLTTAATLPATVIVKGKVKDQNGLALPGATIQIKGTSTGVVSDADGEFKLTLPESENMILVFSFIGMKTKEVPFKGQEMLEIILEENVAEIGEVVVNGIFERKAESYTGSATVIRKEELMRSGNQNLLQNLKNIDPSFRIVENLDYGSDPNLMPEIQMRGEQGIPDLKGSYNGNPNQPLFILDGFEASINTIFDLDMNRVETVVLLKDAAAKAIYGSRAANGVVVIETRRPEAGKLKISYQGEVNLTIPDLTGYNLCNSWEKYMVEKEYNPYDMITLPDYLLSREQYLNDILKAMAEGVDTYWLSQPLRTGIGHKHSVYLEGGDERIRYGVDLLYNDVNGIMKKSARETFTGGFMLSYRYRNLLFRNQFNVTLNRADDSPYGSFSDYVRMNPYWTVYDENGDIKQIAGATGGGGVKVTKYGNPVYNGTLNTKNLSKYTELINNFYIEWNLLENLKATGRLGLSKKQNSRDDFYPASHGRFINYTDDRFFERGSYDKQFGESMSVRGDINLNYSLLLEKHQLFLNAGYNIQQNSSENVGFKTEGFPNDRMDFIAYAKQYARNTTPSGEEGVSREFGILSAMNYSYDNRYLADLSYRATASSMFGQDKRWGQFWSAGIGWNVHNEHFLKDIEWLRQFKLRASTGNTGAQNFNPYQALATFKYYSDQSYDNWLGSYLMGLPNKQLKWQKTQDYNVGMDLNLWGRLNATFNYYVSNTADQLLDLTIPPSMGFTSYRENIGSTQNRGWELKLNGHILADTEKNRFLSVFFSIAGNTNKIRKISNALQSYNDAQDEDLATNQEAYKPSLRFVEGQSIRAIWAVRSLGINPGSGKELWLTKDGKMTSVWDVRNQVVCGDATPKCTGNFGLNMDYQGVFLNMSFYYRFGGQIYNQTLVNRVESASVYENVDQRIFGAVWHKPNDRVAFSYRPWNLTKPTSRFVQDLNELQLSVLNVGYDFKHCLFVRKIGLERLKASFYMNDVFRLSTVKIERGLEYPFARTYSFSLQVTF